MHFPKDTMNPFFGQLTEQTLNDTTHYGFNKYFMHIFFFTEGFQRWHFYDIYFTN